MVGALSFARFLLTSSWTNGRCLLGWSSLRSCRNSRVKGLRGGDSASSAGDRGRCW